jgi:hypothetical protein
VIRVAPARNPRNTLGLKTEGIKQQGRPEKEIGRQMHIEMKNPMMMLERDNQFQVTILVSVFKN